MNSNGDEWKLRGDYPLVFEDHTQVYLECENLRVIRRDNIGEESFFLVFLQKMEEKDGKVGEKWVTRP
jgi:hypothetical protein